MTFAEWFDTNIYGILVIVGLAIIILLFMLLNKRKKVVEPVVQPQPFQQHPSYSILEDPAFFDIGIMEQSSLAEVYEQKEKAKKNRERIIELYQRAKKAYREITDESVKQAKIVQLVELERKLKSQIVTYTKQEQHFDSEIARLGGIKEGAEHVGESQRGVGKRRY